MIAFRAFWVLAQMLVYTLHPSVSIQASFNELAYININIFDRLK